MSVLHDATSEKLDAAQAYAELGYRVFPCRENDKRPATLNGCKEATTDPDKLVEWFTRWPNANIGLATDGFLVLDIDGADNPWLTPERAHDLLNVPMQTTPRGGRHYFFRCEGHRNTASKIAPNIDTRGEGGYVLVAPSVVDGKRYQFAPDQDLTCGPEWMPDVPGWLADCLSRQTTTERSVNPSRVTDLEAVPEGSRNQTLTSIAGTMRRRGMSLEAIEAALLADNEKRFDPPLPRAEVENIAKSVCRYTPDAEAVEALTNGPKQIEKFTLRDLCQGFPRLNPPVIDGLLRVGETANIIADPKRGKSWLAYCIALSVIAGRPLFGRFPTTPGKVLLIDNELHKPTIAGRIPLVAEAMGLDIADIADNLVIWPLRGNLRDLEQLAKEFAKVEPGEFILTILDAWYRAIPKDVSENDNASIAHLYNTIDRHAAHLGCAFANIHHASKGIQSDKKITDVGAGAGSQSRAADCHLVLREHEEENTVVLDAAVRSFPPVSPILLRWEFPIWVPDEDGDVTALKGKKTRGEERQEDRDLKDQGIVLDALNEPRTRTDLRTKTGFGREKLDRLVAKLTRAGFVEDTTIEVRGVERDAVRKTLKARD